MIDDEELIRYLYDDTLDATAKARLDAELAGSHELRERLEGLRAELANAALQLDGPEPDAGYERRVWARLEPKLPVRESWLARLVGLFAVPKPQRFAFAAFAIAALTLGMFIGRSVGPGPQPEPVADAPLLAGDSGDRVLVAYLASHLEATERVLLVAANSPHDTETSSALAESLVDSNRLYALAAERANKPQLARFLRELEPVLIELANASEATDAGAIGDGIRRRDLAFKARAAAALARSDTSVPL